jgi:outer membrane receptor protein involved in Fe transport
MRARASLAIALMGATAMSFASRAHAESSAPSAVGEVVVTAQKHVSTVQKTTASIVAVTGADLQNRGIANLATLAQGTPGVSLKSEGPSQTEIEMRGMTSSGGNSATVGFYLDDIPLTGPASAQNGHVVIDPDLYDLDRVEILRGPQGTLFGSGSMGGTVRLITNQPDPTGYHVSAESTLSDTEGGSFNHADNLMVNIPIVKDKLALRVVGSEDYTSGWINRIVVNPFPLVSADGSTRGAVQDAPVQKEYPGSNAYQIYGTRASLLWTPTPNLSITPSFFYETSHQNGISAYDSVSNGIGVPGFGEAHYQPFDIAEPLNDEITAYSLKVNYSFPDFDLTSSTAYWSRRSSQEEEASEAFNSPITAVTYASNNGLPNPGYYGPTGSGPEYGVENDPSHQWSEELRLTSKGAGRLNWVVGLFYSDFYSLWTFNGTTPNFSSFMDLGTLAPATTPNWFDANSPTTLKQVAAFGDVTYALTDELKLDVGARVNRYDYRFSSCISGWGSALGAATPSCTGLIALSAYAFNPKVDLSYTFSPDMMVYGSVASGSRPGGGNAIYPTTGPVWGPAFAHMNYTSGQWPATYKQDSVWSYELGVKARFFDRRLTVNASVYYEDWADIQLEAYPDDWAMIINGKYAHVAGADVDIRAILGAGFDVEASVGYLHEVLNGGPHWDIPPTGVLPEVAPVNGTIVLAYSRPLNDSYTFTARLENSYTGQRYSLTFPTQDEATGAYTEMPAYDLTNIRVGIKFRDTWTATVFANNLFNKHAALEGMFTENLPTTPYTRIETNQPFTAGVDLTYHY